MTLHTNLKPPVNARRIWRVADLPHERGLAQYEIANEGQPARIVTLAKRQRQVMDLLMLAPVHCASPVRISDILADILSDAIEARRDADITETVLLQEAKFRATLPAILGDAP